MDVNQGLDRGDLTPAAVSRADPFALAQLLGGLSQHDMARLDATQLEAVAIAGERITAAVQARQSLAVDLLADRVEAELEQSGSQHSRLVGAGGADVHGLVASRLAPSLHSATRTVQRRVERDRRLVRLAESTFECHWRGDLERFRTDVIVDGARAVGPEHLPAFEALVLETSVDEETGVVELVSDRVRQMSRSELARRAGQDRPRPGSARRPAGTRVGRGVPPHRGPTGPACAGHGPLECPPALRNQPARPGRGGRAGRPALPGQPRRAGRCAARRRPRRPGAGQRRHHDRRRAGRPRRPGPLLPDGRRRNASPWHGWVSYGQRSGRRPRAGRAVAPAHCAGRCPTRRPRARPRSPTSSAVPTPWSGWRGSTPTAASCRTRAVTDRARAPGAE